MCVSSSERGLRSKVGSQEGVILLQHLPWAMLLHRASCKALRAGVTSRVRWAHSMPCVGMTCGSVCLHAREGPAPNMAAGEVGVGTWDVSCTTPQLDRAPVLGAMWADNAPHGSKHRGVLTSCKCDGGLKCREGHGMGRVCSHARTTLFSVCQLRDHMPLGKG